MHATPLPSRPTRLRSPKLLQILAGWSTAGTIAALPLSWLKFSAISAVFVFAGFGALVFIARLVTEPKYFKVHAIDVMVVTYLLYSLALISPNASPFLLIKSTAYLLSYIAIRSNIEQLPNKNMWLVRGSIAGLIAFATFFLVGAIGSGVGLGDFLSFSYWNVTYRALGFFINDINDVGNAALMRNTVSNSLLLLVVIFSVNNKTNMILIAAAEIFFMQSRRAVLGFVYVIVTTGRLDWRKGVMLLIGAVFIIFLIGAIESGQVETRLDSFSDATRAAQLSSAWGYFQQNIWFGAGYGETVFGFYVHNFIAASAFMCGIFSFILSICIVLYAIFLMFGRSPYRSAMIVFLANAMLSPTVEGIFSMEAWTALAIVVATQNYRVVSHASERKKRRRSNLAFGQ